MAIGHGSIILFLLAIAAVAAYRLSQTDPTLKEATSDSLLWLMGALLLLALAVTIATGLRTSRVVRRADKERAARQQRDHELEAKSQFLDGTWHQLRTPLNSMIAFAEMLQREEAGQLLPEQRRYVESILGGGHHLLMLVNDILALSEIEAGRVELSLGQVGVGDLLGRAVQLSETLAKEKSIEIEVETREDLVVSADASRLQQVVLNLLSNAIKSTPTGGRVRLQADRQGMFARIAVADSGAGMAPKVRERIFEGFQRGEGVSGADPEDSGLGLALARRLVLLQGGRIEVASEVGQGTRFIFTVPLVDPVRQAA
jgi:signal transduction histidine kinase